MPYQFIWQAMLTLVFIGAVSATIVHSRDWWWFAPFAPLFCGLLASASGSLWFVAAAVGRRVAVADGSVVVRRFVSSTSFDIAAVRRVERYDWNIAGAHEHDVWCIDVGRRLAVYVDDRAAGFDRLRQVLLDRKTPIVVGRRTLIRSQVFDIEPATTDV